MSASLLVIVIAAIQAAIAIPLLLGIVPPNGYYGLRTPKTRDETRWYGANRFFAITLLWASAVSICLALALPDAGEPSVLGMLPFLVPMGVAVVASLIYVWRMP